MTKLKVCFEIEGDGISDDVLLDRESLEQTIMFELDKESGNNYYHRVYTTVTNLKVEEIN